MLLYKYYAYNINAGFISNNFIAHFNCSMLHPGVKT